MRLLMSEYQYNYCILVTNEVIFAQINLVKSYREAIQVDETVFYFIFLSNCFTTGLIKIPFH